MEVAGVVFRQSPCFYPATVDGGSSIHSHCFIKKPNSFSMKQQQKLNRKSLGVFVKSGEFSDKSHLKYYETPRMEMKVKEEKKEVKKKLKLLKGLSKNLNAFSDLGFCLQSGDGLDQQVKGQMISEATDVLLAQLEKLKEEKMESKRIKKEEKAKKKASRMMMMTTKTKCNDDSSSSSESSSSESDCDNSNVVNMSQLKTVIATPNIDQEAPPQSPVEIVGKSENIVTETSISKVVSNLNVECGKKIEVCMGGKCKKSGAAMLLENFQNAVAGEVEVVGCKCMGKCQDGPNVRVRDEEVATATAMAKASSMCIGVGLEDVDRIVTSFFGGSPGLCSDMAPAL